MVQTPAPSQFTVTSSYSAHHLITLDLSSTCTPPISQQKYNTCINSIACRSCSLKLYCFDHIPVAVSATSCSVRMPEQSNDYRVVVFGAGGVGKSSLVLRFVKGTFRESYIPTIEDTYRQVIIPNTNSRIYHDTRTLWCLLVT